MHVLPMISLCLSFCKPVTVNQTLNNKDEIEEEENNSQDFLVISENKIDNLTHNFLLAELEFLCIVLNKYSTSLTSQSAIMIALLVDFFQQVCFKK